MGGTLSALEMPAEHTAQAWYLGLASLCVRACGAWEDAEGHCPLPGAWTSALGSLALVMGGIGHASASRAPLLLGQEGRRASHAGISPHLPPSLTILLLTVSQALQAPACHENLVKVGGYILGEFGNLIAGDPRSR